MSTDTPAREARRKRSDEATQLNRPHTGGVAREHLLAGMPVTERRLDLAGLATAVVEGGDGPPVVLLHGPLGHAGHWMQTIPRLVTSFRVIVPDLPGHGASEIDDVPLDADRVLAWLGELIAATCTSPPSLVGQTLGGAIAARFAIRKCDRLSRLVLVDTFGLTQLKLPPEFELAVTEFLADPTERTHEILWRHCAFDLAGLRQKMRKQWAPFEAYNVDRARQPDAQPALGTLLQQFEPAIPPTDLARIDVPTTLIWGRHDRATPLAVAEAVSTRYGWPLHVIENAADDPAVEQPEALLRVLRVVLAPA